MIAAAEFLRGQPGREAMAWLHHEFGRLEPVTREVGVRWAAVQRRRDQRGKPMGTNDAWLVAAALTLRCPILTHDGNYSGLPGLRIARYTLAPA